MGGIELSNVTADGQPTTTWIESDPTVVWIDLPAPADLDGSAKIELDFTTTIPTGTTMAVNVLHGDSEQGWWLADWHPILAGWEPGIGWFLDPPGPLGNPTFATSASWSLELTLPADLKVAGTGQVVDAEITPAGDQRFRIESPAARDVTLVVLPAKDITTAQRSTGDILVRVTLPEQVALPPLTDLLLITASEVLPFYQEWLGTLPEAEIDLLPVSLNGFGGIAWSGSVWLDLAQFSDADLADPAIRADLRFVLAHELAHQWVPLLIGSNNNRHNFLSESLASHLALLALGTSGDETTVGYFADDIARSYRSMLERGHDGTVDDPVASTSPSADRANLVYGKGVLGFEAIRQAIGHEDYLRGLARYADTFRFGTSTPADLRSAFEGTSGQDLSVLWSMWFESASTTLADVDQVLSRFESTFAGTFSTPVATFAGTESGWTVTMARTWSQAPIERSLSISRSRAASGNCPAEGPAPCCPEPTRLLGADALA
jgi:hypothetical protein